MAVAKRAFCAAGTVMNGLNEPTVTCRISEVGDKICLGDVIPEFFYRGSRSPLSWIPRFKHAGMTDRQFTSPGTFGKQTQRT